MKDQISHEKAHEAWSEKQFALFQNMGARERLHTVKTGALEHWTTADRDAALELIAQAPSARQDTLSSKRLRFEPALIPLPALKARPTRVDPMVAAAVAGWLFITTALVGRVYGFY